MRWLLLFLPVILAVDHELLKPFNLTQNVTSQTGKGFTVVANSYPTLSNPTVENNVTFGIDIPGKRLAFRMGIFGDVIALPNITYATFFSNPLQTFVCATIPFGFEYDIKSYALMTNKGTAPSLVLEFKPNPWQVLTTYSGYASDTTQCNQSLAYAWVVDDEKMLRKVYADSPLDVPIPDTNFTTPIVVSQYIQLNQVKKGIPDPSVFALPPSCTTPLSLPDWCSIFFHAGVFALYPPGTFD